jgi:hypothetical protein
MKSRLLVIGISSLALSLLLGCNSKPQETYNYAPTQQQAAPPPQDVQMESITNNGQQTVNRACLNSQGQVVEDRYCDQQWIEQQRQLAQQRHDDAMLQSLLMYHFMFGGTVNPYGIYVGGVYTVPSGYVYMPYSTYHERVVNRTVIVNRTVVHNYVPPPSAQRFVQPSQKMAPNARSTATTTTRGPGATGLSSQSQSKTFSPPTKTFSPSTKSYGSSSGGSSFGRKK